jgi:transcriptional regulator with XRE-family HTH domain
MSATRKSLAVCFGKHLRAIRQQARITQEELGFRACLHRTEIGLLERGLREPRLDTIIKLAGALSVSPGVLLKGMGPEDVPTG